MDDLVERRPNGHWAPGSSGNPRGRVRDEKIREVRELALAACPDAIKGLIDIMEDKKERAAVRATAMVEILNRGMGKALQMHVASDRDGTPLDIDMTENEVARRIAFALELGMRNMSARVVSSVPASLASTIESTGE